MEEDCDGLCWKYLIEEKGLRPDLVVCTEPTNLGLYRGHRGRMEIEVSFKGLSAHGSAPERGRNAIYPASRACLAVEQLNERLRGDPFLGKGTVTVSQFLSGSPSLCAVADSARIHLDRRLTAGETRESALSEVEALAGPLGGTAEVLRYHARSWTGLAYGMDKYYPTWQLAPDHPAVLSGSSACRALFDEEPRVGKWTFSTNCVTINGIHGIPTIGFGPGDEVQAHAPDESVSVEHLARASAFYAALAWAFAGGG
jgi:putative selenium metabolism hydrolase